MCLEKSGLYKRQITVKCQPFGETEGIFITAHHPEVRTRLSGLKDFIEIL